MRHSGTFRLAVLASSIASVQAQHPLFANVSSQCVGASGFTSCWANATSTAQTCFSSVPRCANTGSCTDENTCSSTANDCAVNCVCTAYTNWINCALSHCWNKVYSCAYQNLALRAARSCPGAGQGPLNTGDHDGYIPYTPPPADAPGECSCALSYVGYRYAASGLHARSCVANRNASTPGGSEVQDDRCRCCGASEAVSAFYNSCPATAPGSVPLFDETIGERVTLLKSATCRAVLGGKNGFDCRRLGYSRPGIRGGEFLTADDLPANGTATLADTTGNTIASPVGGPTVVWRLGERFGNVTAVAFSATPAATTGAGHNAASGLRANTDVIPLLWLVAMFAFGFLLL